MITDDFSVQIKLIIMYAIGIIALLVLLFGLYRKHYSFKNKNILMVSAITIVMMFILGDVIGLP